MKTTRCRSCSAPIAFVRTTTGGLIPLDAEPNPAGNVVLAGTFSGEQKAQVIGAPSLFDNPDDDRVRYMPHHATCPDAADWKSR